MTFGKIINPSAKMGTEKVRFLNEVPDTFKILVSNLVQQDFFLKWARPENWSASSLNYLYIIMTATMFIAAHDYAMRYAHTQDTKYIIVYACLASIAYWLFAQMISSDGMISAIIVVGGLITIGSIALAVIMGDKLTHLKGLACVLAVAAGALLSFEQ